MKGSRYALWVEHALMEVAAQLITVDEVDRMLEIRLETSLEAALETFGGR